MRCFAVLVSSVTALTITPPTPDFASGGFAPTPAVAASGAVAPLSDMGLGEGTETQVLPSTIDLRDPIWTVLVVGPDAPHVVAANLSVLDRDSSPISVITTSPTSVLLTFGLPTNSDAEDAVLHLRTREQSLAFSLAVTEHPGDPFRNLAGTKLEMIAIAGRVGFDGSTASRTLDESGAMHARLRSWLQAAGVSRINKAMEGPERDYVVKDSIEETIDALRHLGRVYVLSTPSGTNPRSIQEILRLCPDVTTIEVSPRVVQNAQPVVRDTSANRPVDAARRPG